MGVGILNSPQKTNRTASELNGIMHPMNLTDIARIFHPALKDTHTTQLFMEASLKSTIYWDIKQVLTNSKRLN